MYRLKQLYDTPNRFIILALNIILTGVIISIMIISYINYKLDAQYLTFFGLLCLFWAVDIFQIIFKVRLSTCLRYIFIIFSSLGLLFGTCLGLYEQFPWWDTMCHGVFGFVGGFIAIGIIQAFGKQELKFKTLAIFTIIATFGLIWELIEFTVDSIFTMNTQHNDTSGVNDTMIDFVSNTVGSLIFVIFYYPCQKLQKFKLFLNLCNDCESSKKLTEKTDDTLIE